jgi:hypothetical protein
MYSLAKRFELNPLSIRSEGDQASLVSSEYGGMMLGQPFEHVGMRVVKLVLITI